MISDMISNSYIISWILIISHGAKMLKDISYVISYMVFEVSAKISGALIKFDNLSASKLLRQDHSDHSRVIILSLHKI